MITDQIVRELDGLVASAGREASKRDYPPRCNMENIMKKLIIITALAPFMAYAANSAARAQDATAFSGDCKAYAADKATCDATKWCHFVQRKPVTLPDGQQFTPAAYCAFKAGFKQAWQQQQAKQ